MAGCGQGPASPGIGEDAWRKVRKNFPSFNSPMAPSWSIRLLRELAEKVGMQTRAESKLYDVIIIGAGPAGLAAAVYGCSEGQSVVVLEKGVPGGQAGNSPKIENYLGFPSGLSGMELARRALAQAKRFGAEILEATEATRVRVEGKYRVVTLARWLGNCWQNFVDCERRNFPRTGCARSQGTDGRGRVLWRGIHRSHVLQRAAGVRRRRREFSGTRRDVSQPTLLAR